MPNYKVVDADELDRKLSRIGDSVRGKTGGTELIPIDDIPVAIDGIEAGGGGTGLGELISRTITEVSDNTLTTVGNYAFHSCEDLETVSFPSVTDIGSYSFYGCKSMVGVNIPLIADVPAQAFRNCLSLEIIDLHNCSSIAANAFNSCRNLETVIIRKTDAVCTLAGINAFGSTPLLDGGGKLYVPEALVEEYMSASNWSAIFEEETCEFLPIEGSEYE